MRKYIDAEETKQTFCAECNHTLKCEDCDIDFHFRYAPAADVVEVVRCKDCKYRDDDDFCTGRGYPNVLVPDDGFCDKGERRELWTT